jgi:hypothetical protein
MKTEPLPGGNAGLSREGCSSLLWKADFRYFLFNLGKIRLYNFRRFSVFLQPSLMKQMRRCHELLVRQFVHARPVTHL